MSTFANRPKTALLVIDVQNKVVAGAHQRDTVVANIAAAVEKARANGVPVVWVQHISEELPKDSEAGQIVRALVPAAGEPVVMKFYGDAFEDTDLETILAGLGVGRLIVTGAQTDACIRSTLHGGLARGYDVILVSDAHTTDDLSSYGAPTPDKVIAHTNLYWKHQRAPGRTCATVATEDLDLSATA